MQPPDIDETRATARLPNLDIDIVHRRARDGESELLTINLRATPSFQAFEQFLEAANPFSFWLRAAELAWSPWLMAARQLAGQPIEQAPAPRDLPRLQRPRGGRSR